MFRVKFGTEKMERHTELVGQDLLITASWLHLQSFSAPFLNAF